MDLSRYAREFYAVEISTEPPLAGWEASFDHGVTWHDGDPLLDEDNTWRWLLHGPDFLTPDGDTSPSIPVVTPSLFTSSVIPLLRAIDNPEVVVRDAPEVKILD